jgi:hypothetical protein
MCLLVKLAAFGREPLQTPFVHDTDLTSPELSSMSGFANVYLGTHFSVKVAVKRLGCLRALMELLFSWLVS